MCIADGISHQYAKYLVFIFLFLSASPSLSLSRSARLCYNFFLFDTNVLPRSNCCSCLCVCFHWQKSYSHECSIFKYNVSEGNSDVSISVLVHFFVVTLTLLPFTIIATYAVVEQKSGLSDTMIRWYRYTDDSQRLCVYNTNKLKKKKKCVKPVAILHCCLPTRQQKP